MRFGLAQLFGVAQRSRASQRFSMVQGFSSLVMLFLASVRIAKFMDASTIFVVVAAVFLCAVSWVDVGRHIIPNPLNLAFFLAAVVAVGVATIVVGQPEAFWRATAAATGMFLGFWLLHVVSGGGLGGGDVKLAPSLGLVLGWFSWETVWVALLLAFLLNGLAAVMVVVVGFFVSHAQASKTKESLKLPFAPALGYGTLLALLVV